MKLFRMFRKSSPEQAIEDGLEQAERELFNAKLAEHTARSHIDYWESRAMLLLRLKYEKKAPLFSDAPTFPVLNELG